MAGKNDNFDALMAMMAQDIYQSHDQSSHNADESSDGVIDGTFKEVDE